MFEVTFIKHVPFTFCQFQKMFVNPLAKCQTILCGMPIMVIDILRVGSNPKPIVVG